MAYVQIILLLLGLSLYKTDAVASTRGQFHSDKKKVCMRYIGCFELTDDFNGRVINLLPQDRRLINTQFFLYTRNNPNEKHLLISSKPRTLIHSPLDTTLPTKFIVHGFLDNQLFAKWQTEMKDELMKKDEYNIITVDWSGGNQLPYSQAAANTRVVGAEIAFLINQLQKYLDLNIKTCHIIGHSLGAHIAGYAGERLNKLQRITALDPAEPLFQDFPPSVRIDPTDAELVDAIHTDSDSILVLGFGMRQLVGHLDFFPNDGRKQPGCETHKRIWSLITEGIDGIKNFASCSHQRAVDFFKASINLKNCKPIGHHCSNWTEFINGRCAGCGPNGSECATMGLEADQFKVKDQNASIEVFLKTDEEAPFCLYHSRVTVHLSTKSEEPLKGKISLGVSDKFGKEITVPLGEKYYDFIPGDNLIFVMATPIEIDLNNPISFKWISDSFFTLAQISVEDVEILPMNYEDETVQMSHRTVYYQSTNNPIKESKTVKMYPSKNTL